MSFKKYADAKGEIDFIFSLVPLWITYSGLPKKLGAAVWCTFRRLLELRHRFGDTKFFYPMERLCETTGAPDKKSMKKILDKLQKENLIKYETYTGRGKATSFEIIEPLNAPLSEEDVYRLNPRLRSKSYKKRILEETENKKGANHPLFEDDENDVEEKEVIRPLLENKKGANHLLLYREKGVNHPLLDAKKGAIRPPIKKDIHEKDNNNKKDLSHEKEKYPDLNKVGDTLAVTPLTDTNVGEVVVAINVNKLKEYGISGDDAEKFLKKYSQAYLAEKIEIIEFKRSNGDEIRNIGGMLRKAIAEDWQPPPGFTTRAQREKEARRKREAEELALREAREKEEREKMERDRAKIAEEWRKNATQEEMREITERARREIMAENPGQNERWLGPQVRIREERIIAEEYAKDEKTVRSES